MEKPTQPGLGPTTFAAVAVAVPGRAPIVLRTAQPAEAPAILALIEAHLAEGHLLPRTLEDVESRTDGFVVAMVDGQLVGCAELAPLSGTVAEVRSLVVSREARALGLGTRLVAELDRRARIDGFAKLVAFTHQPGYFVRMGFTIVPHLWVPEKIVHDCQACPLFRRCGQQAVVLTLDPRPGRVN
ncbi:MAG: GNAT family N-acetyltransferase [Vicinamibacterales bacterium]